jgi:hypothetical protein
VEEVAFKASASKKQKTSKTPPKDVKADKTPSKKKEKNKKTESEKEEREVEEEDEDEDALDL